MGLISLALSDATGVLARNEARTMALQTLKFSAGKGVIGGKRYQSKRAQDGWFRHWFEINTGADNDWSRSDGYSTIDTTILVAGAQLTANYFKSVGADKNGELSRLADQLLLSIRWEKAIVNLGTGHRIYSRLPTSAQTFAEDARTRRMPLLLPRAQIPMAMLTERSDNSV
jgi:hypothetical protein